MNALILAVAAPLFLLSAFAWANVIWRLRTHRDVVPYERRRLVPWGGQWILLGMVVYLGMAFVIGSLALTAFADGLPMPERLQFLAMGEADKFAYPGFFLTMIKADSAGKLIAVGVVAGMLALFTRANSDDLGISVRGLWRRILLGFFAFFVIVPPTLMLQAFLVEGLGIKYEHALIDAVGDGKNPDLLLWSMFAAVFVAPLVEEFLFRGLLQGWLERTVAAIKAPEALPVPSVSESDFVPLNDAPREDVSLSAVPPESTPIAADANTDAKTDVRPSSMPIIISSALFAAMHLGQGPAPITLFFFALGLGYLYRQTHSIWPGVVVHFMLNSFSMAWLVFVGK